MDAALENLLSSMLSRGLCKEWKDLLISPDLTCFLMSGKSNEPKDTKEAVTELHRFQKLELELSLLPICGDYSENAAKLIESEIAKLKKMAREFRIEDMKNSRESPSRLMFPSHDLNEMLNYNKPPSPLEDGFKPAKRSRKSPRSSVTSSTIELNNIFENLPQDVQAEDVELPSPGSSGRTTPIPPKPKLPPIVVDLTEETTDLPKKIAVLVENRLVAKVRKDTVLFYLENTEDLDAVKKFISENNFQAHTFPTKEEKLMKVFIHGLTKDFCPDELKELLVEDFPDIAVNQILDRKTKKPTDLFLIYLPRNENSKKIFKLDMIKFYAVKVVNQRKRKMPPQCYNCLGFYHHSRNCNRIPKCLKCAGNHRAKDCTRDRNEPATCLLCQGPHPANFSGCPKNPVNREIRNTRRTQPVFARRKYDDEFPPLGNQVPDGDSGAVAAPGNFPSQKVTAPLMIPREVELTSRRSSAYPKPTRSHARQPAEPTEHDQSETRSHQVNQPINEEILASLIKTLQQTASQLNELFAMLKPILAERLSSN